MVASTLPLVAAPPTPVRSRCVPRSNLGLAPEFHTPSLRRTGARDRARRLRSAAVALALLPCVAMAHAIIVAAQPAMNSTVAPGELAIRLEFNSRLDRQRSGLSLRAPDGSEVAVALTPGAPPGVLAGRAQVTAGKPWTLHWQALSLDGHITRGEVIFSVREPASAR
jgi:methionine-rich copper-binding protein CopC